MPATVERLSVTSRKVLKMKKAIAVLLFSLGIVSCYKKDSPTIDACVTRGIIYFSKIGSYPRLRENNRYATEVARERCRQTTTAF